MERSQPLDAEASQVAREMILKLVGLARSMNDQGKLAMALHTLGHSCVLSGELDESERAFDECREISLRTGDKRGAALTLAMLGFLDVLRDRLEAGLPRVLEALGDVAPGDAARALVAARVAEAAKRFERARFDAALRAAGRAHPKEVVGELEKAIEASRVPA